MANEIFDELEQKGIKGLNKTDERLHRLMLPEKDMKATEQKFIHAIETMVESGYIDKEDKAEVIFGVQNALDKYENAEKNRSYSVDDPEANMEAKKLMDELGLEQKDGGKKPG